MVWKSESHIEDLRSKAWIGGIRIKNLELNAKNK